MTTTTVPALTGEELAASFAVLADEDLVHVVWWCRPDVALCGEPIPGDDYVDDDADEVWCPECVAIDRAEEPAHLIVCAVCREAEA